MELTFPGVLGFPSGLNLVGADSWRMGYKDVALPEVVLPEDHQAGKFTSSCCTAAGVVDRNQAFSWLCRVSRVQ